MGVESTDLTQQPLTKGDASDEAGSAAPAETPGDEMLEARVREELKTVIDPEIGLDVVNLGLIYDVKIEAGKAHVVMTLTSPGCPVAGAFLNSVHQTVAAVPGISECSVDLTFSPPWDPRTMASEEAKLTLGFYY